MEILGFLLFGAGILLSIVTGIWLLVLAFQESPLWGVLCLLLNPAMLVFVIMHWQETKKPFLWSLLAIPLMLGGGALTG